MNENMEAASAIASGNPGAASQVASLVSSMRGRGVKLWSENGRVHCESPSGAITPEEVEILKGARHEIVALLESDRNAVVPVIPGRRRPTDRVPLTLSQILHWQSIRSGERTGLRATASAMRVLGVLNLEVLRQSLQQLLLRHEALRTRIIAPKGAPEQRIVGPGQCELDVVDLTGFPELLVESEIQRLTREFIGTPVNVEADSLFAIRLFRVRTEEHVCVVAIEHIVADAVSLAIVWRDLFAGYAQLVSGHRMSLPEVAVQFPDYAVWQIRAHNAWVRKRGAKWNARMKGSAISRFPADMPPPQTAGVGWSSVPLQINATLRAELANWCRQKRTTVPIAVFSVYVALVLRRFGADEAVFQYQTTGRFSLQIENTIGLFASLLYLRIALLNEDSFVDLLNRATQEYCSSYADPDFCYMATQIPRPEFSRNTAFNWIPQAQPLRFPELERTPNAITLQPVPFVNPVLENLAMDADPWVAFMETAEEITGAIYFPINRHSRENMQALSEDFLVLLEALLHRPDTRVREVVLSRS